MTVESYRDLKVWQKAMTLAEGAYLFTKDFPASELYGLTSQMRRAAVSIAANIAEGYGRDTRGAYIAFLRNAQGSLKELETHAILSERLGFAQKSSDLLDACDELGRMLRALIRSLENEQ
jgi:four helix bundle protein